MGALSKNMRGAVLMMLSMAAFTLNDACMKALSNNIPMFQALFLRGLITVPLLLLIARHLGALKFNFPRKDWALIIIRTLAEVTAAYFFVTALFNMPLANATAILQALPLTVTLAGAVFLGERVGWRRLSAITVGFFGVMLIIRPDADGFNIYAIYALIAVACVTVRDLSVRRLSGDVPSVVVALFAAFGVLIFAAVGSTATTWVPVDTRTLTLLTAAGIFVIGGYMFSVMVMRVGDIGFIAPFRYTSLIWALLLGLVVFGDWPDSLTMLGIAVVIGAGLFTLYRERRGRTE